MSGRGGGGRAVGGASIPVPATPADVSRWISEAERTLFTDPNFIAQAHTVYGWLRENSGLQLMGYGDLGPNPTDRQVAEYALSLLRGFSNNTTVLGIVSSQLPPVGNGTPEQARALLGVMEAHGNLPGALNIFNELSVMQRFRLVGRAVIDSVTDPVMVGVGLLTFGVGAVATRASVAAGQQALVHGLRTVAVVAATGGLDGMISAAAADAGTQQVRIAAGEQQAYDPAQTLIQGGVGLVVGTAGGAALGVVAQQTARAVSGVLDGVTGRLAPDFAAAPDAPTIRVPEVPAAPAATRRVDAPPPVGSPFVMFPERQGVPEIGPRVAYGPEGLGSGGTPPAPPPTPPPPTPSTPSAQPSRLRQALQWMARDHEAHATVSARLETLSKPEKLEVPGNLTVEQFRTMLEERELALSGREFTNWQLATGILRNLVPYSMREATEKGGSALGQAISHAFSIRGLVLPLPNIPFAYSWGRAIRAGLVGGLGLGGPLVVTDMLGVTPPAVDRALTGLTQTVGSYTAIVPETIAEYVGLPEDHRIRSLVRAVSGGVTVPFLAAPELVRWGASHLFGHPHGAAVEQAPDTPMQRFANELLNQSDRQRLFEQFRAHTGNDTLFRQYLTYQGEHLSSLGRFWLGDERDLARAPLVIGSGTPLTVLSHPLTGQQGTIEFAPPGLRARVSVVTTPQQRDNMVAPAGDHGNLWLRLELIGTTTTGERIRGLAHYQLDNQQEHQLRQGLQLTQEERPRRSEVSLAVGAVVPPLASVTVEPTRQVAETVARPGTGMIPAATNGPMFGG